jgi:hypothetical protein
MFVTCLDTYSIEQNDVGKYRTPVARFAHRTYVAAERHRRALIRSHPNYPTARLFYVAALIEGERVAP